VPLAFADVVGEPFAQLRARGKVDVTASYQHGDIIARSSVPEGGLVGYVEETHWASRTEDLFAYMPYFRPYETKT
jgi:hypothetical protein